MPTPSTSLSRILELLDVFTKNGGAANPGAVVFNLWAQALAISPLGPALSREQETATLRAIALMSDELARARRDARLTPLEPEDYQGAFDKAAMAFRWEILPQQYGNLGPHMNSEVLGMLRVCSRLVPVREVQLTLDELVAVDEALKRLEEAITELPDGDPFVATLAEQLALMRQARIDYRITGAASLRRGVYELEGALRNQFGTNETAAARGSISEAQGQAIAQAVGVWSTVKRILVQAGIATAALSAAASGAQKLGVIAAETQVYYLSAGDLQTSAADTSDRPE